MGSLRLVRRVLGDDPLGLYSVLDQRGIAGRWPYPPGFLPVVAGSGALADATGTSFETVVRAVPILANAAIALIVQDFLGRRGSSQPARLVATALVALGPSFVIVAGYHGQIDSVAILPAVLALHRWEYAPPRSRAVQAGLLIGLGGALKTVPLLMVLALLPSARSWRESFTLLAAAAAAPVVAFLPFALESALPAGQTMAYKGVPGAGGLSLVAQPDLPQAFLGIREGDLSSVSNKVADFGRLIVLAGVVLVAYVGARSRAAAPIMAVFLWLAVLAFGVNFFFQYAVWLLPFLLMAGHLRVVAVLQGALLAGMGVFYLRPWEEPVVGWAYSVLMIALWLSCVTAVAWLAAALLRSRSGAVTSPGRTGTAIS